MSLEQPQQTVSRARDSEHLNESLRIGSNEQTAKELAMMNEENNNANNNNNNDNYEISGEQFSPTVRPTSRSSSALWSSEGEELNSHCSSGRSSLAVAKSCEYESKNDQYLSSSSTSGAEDTSQSSSPSPELPGEQVERNSCSNGEAAKQLNVHSNLIPETNQANQAVNTIRVKFLESLAKQCSELFEDCDISELHRELPPPGRQEQSLAFRWISRFLNQEQFRKGELSEKEVAEAVEKLGEFLKFRSHYQVPRTKPDHFCQEFFLMYGIFPFGYDRQHLPVLYTRANVHRRWSHKLDESFRRYVAWQVDLMTKSFSGARVQKTIGRSGIEKDGSFGICFDCVNVSYSCVDMDFLRFIVKLLVNCYPTYCRYALCVDLPWLFRSVWQLVRSWLPEEAQDTVQLITSKQLVEYIDEEQIPCSIKTSNEVDRQNVSEKRKHKVPENYESIRNFQEFAKDLKLSSSEMKSFKTHMEKVLKQYRELGALPSMIN